MDIWYYSNTLVASGKEKVRCMTYVYICIVCIFDINSLVALGKEKVKLRKSPNLSL